MASELRIKIYKEVSAGPNEIAEAIDSVMMAVNEPRIALSDDIIQNAQDQDSGSDMVSFLKSRPTLSVTLAGIGVAVLALVGALIFKRRW